MGLVLIIDDEKLFRTAARYVLEESNFTVLEADNGNEGIELARENRPDVIICDVHMRGLHGYATIQMLKKRPETEQTPVIMITGRASPFGERRGTEAGADYYISKPLSADKLISAVEIAMAQGASGYSSKQEEFRGSGLIM